MSPATDVWFAIRSNRVYRRSYFGTIVAGVACLSLISANAKAQEAATPPNVVLILAALWRYISVKSYLAELYITSTG